MRVIGIDRSGKTVPIAAWLVGANTRPVLVFSGHSAQVPPGRYAVGADVAAGLVHTVVARFVRVSASTTVRLDARHGKLMKVSLDAVGATAGNVDAGVCLTNGQFTASVDAIASQGGLYVVPVASKHLPFFYLSSWQRGADTVYDLAGHDAAGVPSDPSFHFTTSSLATISLAVRRGTTIEPSGTLDVRPVRAGDCIPEVDVSAVAAGSHLTAYRTAGRWVTTYGLSSPSTMWATGPLRAGHRHAITFGSAAYAPGPDFPQISGHHLNYLPGGLFSDPVTHGGDMFSRGNIALSSGGKDGSHRELRLARASVHGPN